MIYDIQRYLLDTSIGLPWTSRMGGQQGLICCANLKESRERAYDFTTLPTSQTVDLVL